MSIKITDQTNEIQSSNTTGGISYEISAADNALLIASRSFAGAQENSRDTYPLRDLQIIADNRLAETSEQTVEQKIQNIEDTYNVLITPPGLPVGIPESAMLYTTRQPTLPELEGLEAGLMRSLPTSADSGARISIQFIAEVPAGNSRASYLPEQNGGPAIQIWPAARNFPPTQAEDMRSDEQRENGRGSLRGSLEEIITHEYGHRAADNLDVLFEENSQIASELGFHHLPASGEGQSDRWLVRGVDGYFYEEFAGGWTRADRNGNPLNADGQPSDRKQAFRITDDQLNEFAVVPPSSQYAVNPNEVFAEGMLYFRLNEQERAAMRDRTPALYEVIRNYDQMEIDRNYGTDSAGNPRYLRLPNGSINRNTSDSRAQLSEFERR